MKIKAALIVLILGVVGFLAYLNWGKTNDNGSALTAEKEITETDSGFFPNELTIKKGDTVTFKSTRGKPFWPASDLHPTHGVYPDFDPKQPIDPNQTWSFKFDKVGNWKYHDH